MIALILTTAAVVGVPDYCQWENSKQSVEPLVVTDRGQLRLYVPYPSVWALCAAKTGAKPPRLRITTRDGGGKPKVVESEVEIRGSLNPNQFGRIYRDFKPCEQASNQRHKDAVLHGPTGRRLWHNPTTITVEIVAKGAYAPLAYRGQAQWLCPACVSEKGTASISHYRPEKGITRFFVRFPKWRHECADGGGSLVLRRFWLDGGKDKWYPLRPYEEVRDLQSKLRRKDDDMFYEEKTPIEKLCKVNKEAIWEVVGIDEYALIANRSGYGPSRHIRRDGIEFLRCE